MERIRIQPKLPMFADRWYIEMGENKFVKRIAGKAYAIGADGKMVANARYVCETPEGLKEIVDGDWIVYQKTLEGATCRVYSPREFEAAFKEYQRYEKTPEEKTI